MSTVGSSPKQSVRFIYEHEKKLQQFQKIVEGSDLSNIEFVPVTCSEVVFLKESEPGGVTFIDGTIIKDKESCPGFVKLFDQFSSRFVLIIDPDDEAQALVYISKGVDTYLTWEELNIDVFCRTLKIAKAKRSRLGKDNSYILDSFYFSKIFEQAREAIAVIDTNYRYLKVNAAYEKVFGYSNEFLLSKTPAIIIGKGPLERNMSIIKETGEPLIREVEITNQEGKKLAVELSIFPVKNWEGEIIAYVGINKDRTEEREIKSALHDSEEKFTKAFETIPDAVAITRTSDGQYVDCNDGFTRLTGYSKEDLYGKTTFEISLWYDENQRKELIKELVEREYIKDVEVKFRKKDGEIRTGLISMNILDLENEKYLLSMTRDITDWLDVQDALLDSESNLKRAQEIAHLGSWELNYQNKIINFSEEAGKILSLPLTSLSFRYDRLAKLMDEQTAESFKKLIDTSLKKMVNSFDGELNIRENGSIVRYSHVLGEIERNRDDDILMIHGSIQDVSESVIAQEKIEEKDKTLTYFAENISDKIIRTDLNGRVQYVSKSIIDLLGYTQDEYRGTLIYEHIHPDDLQYVLESFKKAMFEKISNLEYRMRHKNGDYLWVESRGHSIKDKEGEISGMVAGTTLIHDKKVALEQLKESEEKFRLLIQNNFDLIFEVDSQRKITYISQNIQQLLDYPQFDIIGRDFEAYIHPSDLDISRSLLGEESGIFNIRYRHRDGEWRWFESAGRNYLNQDGETVSLIISKDITERKDYEEALTVSESKFRSLTENSGDIIMRFDRKHKVLYTNSAGESWFYQPVKEDDLYLNDSILENGILRQLKLNIELVFSTTEIHGMQFSLMVDGENRNYDWQGFPELSSSHKIESVLGVARDITAFTQTQDELNKLHQVIESSTNSIILTDKDGIIEHVNPKTLEVTGYDYDDLVGQNPRVLKSGHTPKEVYKQLWDTIRSGHAWKGEFSNRKKNGTLFWEFAVISPIKNQKGEVINFLAIKEDISRQKKTDELMRQSKETLAMTLEANQIGTWSWDLKTEEFAFDDQATIIFCLDRDFDRPYTTKDIISFIYPKDMNKVNALARESLEKGNTMDFDFRIQDNDGAIRHLIIKSRITRNSHEKAIRLDGICMDATEAKETEKNLETRNDELNQFVYKVSHDLRAPLASIRGIVELEKIQRKGRPAIKHLGLIEERVLILDEFIRNILSHSRNLNTSLDCLKIDFKKAINDCYKELEFLNNALSVKRISKISGTAFYSDPSRIFEIFRNLISNGIKYVDYNKSEPFIKITVKTSSKECLIDIEDNGIGIAPQFKEKVFEMFYRANEKSEGSGIGLYILKQAVDKLDGKVKMSSGLGIGTKFHITLPNKQVS